MDYRLTAEQMTALQSYLDGNERTAEVDNAIKALTHLSDAVRSENERRYLDSRRQIRELNRKVDRLSRQLSSSAQNATFQDLALDSLDLANVIVFYLQRKGESLFGKTRVIYLLYEAYSSWLGEHMERLCIEHPVATEFGPWFWRVSTKIDVKSRKTQADISKIAESNAGLVKFIENVVNKYDGYSDTRLKEFFCNAKPYRDSLPEHNGGKWNKVISDAEIYFWRKG